MFARLAGLFAPLVIVALVLAGESCAAPADSSGGAARSAASDAIVAADLPPLPPGLATAARPAETVKLAYAFAARHPEVLSYVPCFCGCDRLGHTANHDCFVSRRDKNGRVTQWEDHAMDCEICIDIAIDSMRMYDAGATVAAIRNTIDARYGRSGGPQTPTPVPPAAPAGHD